MTNLQVVLSINMFSVKKEVEKMKDFFEAYDKRISFGNYILTSDKHELYMDINKNGIDFITSRDDEAFLDLVGEFVEKYHSRKLVGIFIDSDNIENKEKIKRICTNKRKTLYLN